MRGSTAFGAYRTGFRLACRTVFGARGTAGRLSLRRALVMAVFLPLLFAVVTGHWIGLALDELLFRGYRRVEVREPLFVVGVPRSGTTFLHRILAEDESQFTVYRLWQMLLAPSITQRKLCHGLARVDRAIGAPGARLVARIERRLSRGLDAVHRISLSEPEEDYVLLAPVFACFLLILPFPFPDQLGHLATFDDSAAPAEQDRVMGFYRSCLQRHLYVEGTDRRFLSKNVSFAPMVRALERTFPDARIVGTVRDPLAAVPSHLSAMSRGMELFGNDAGDDALRRLMIDVQRYAYTHIAETIGSGPPSRRIVIPMERLSSDPGATVRELYARFGLELSPEFDAFLTEQTRRQRSYVSGHRYRLADFGVTEEQIREEFADVIERYGYAPPAEAAR
jgi:hypothetical protein